MMNATRLRLDPIAEKLNEDDLREESGLEVKVPIEVRNRVWDLVNKFNGYYEDLETLGHSLTNKQWRVLKKAVKKIGGVAFTDLEDNLLNICNELLELDIMFP